MSQQFNPPPGWPTPPPGWRPAETWQPDPSWPTPPPGWQFWVDAPTTGPVVPPVQPGAPQFQDAPQYQNAAPTQALQVPPTEQFAPTPGQPYSAAPGQPQIYPPSQVPGGAHYASSSGQPSGGAPTWNTPPGGGTNVNSKGSKWPIVVIAVAGTALVAALVWLAITLLGGDGEPASPLPTASSPSVPAPSTDEPTTEAPTSEEPTTEAPTSEEPTTEAPTSEEPSGEPTQAGGTGPFPAPISGDGSIGGLDDEYSFYATGQPAPLVYSGSEVGTIALLSVEHNWVPERASFMCGEPEYGRYLAIQFEVSVDDRITEVSEDGTYRMGPFDTGFYGPNGELESHEADTWAGLYCLTDEGFDEDMGPGDTATGWVLIDGPADIEAVTVGGFFSFLYSGTIPAWDVRQ